MTQVYKLRLIIVFLFCATIAYACSNKTSSKPIDSNNKPKDSIVVDNRYYYPKIDSLVNLYDRKESITFWEQKLPYPIEDSLCLYFSKLNKKGLIEDEEFKYMAGKLLEKLYLEARKETTKPETFPIYNASILYYGDKSNGFALKIVMENELGIDKEFDKYAHPWQEFICIDSVILVLDKLPQMQNDPNHQKCMYLVKNNKTGGCKW